MFPSLTLGVEVEAVEKGSEPTFSVGVTTSGPEGKGVVLCPVLVSSEMGSHRAWQNLITLYTEE